MKHCAPQEIKSLAITKTLHKQLNHLNDFFANVGEHTYKEIMSGHNKTPSDVCESVMQCSTPFSLFSHSNSLPKKENMWSPSHSSVTVSKGRVRKCILPYLQLLTNASIATNILLYNLKHARSSGPYITKEGKRLLKNETHKPPTSSFQNFVIGHCTSTPRLHVACKPGQ